MLLKLSIHDELSELFSFRELNDISDMVSLIPLMAVLVVSLIGWNPLIVKEAMLVLLDADDDFR